MCERLHHDIAFATAHALVEVIENVLPRPECVRECHSEFYLILRAALDKLEIERRRHEHRMNPSRN